MNTELLSVSRLFASVLVLFCHSTYPMLPRSRSVPSNMSQLATEFRARRQESVKASRPVAAESSTEPQRALAKTPAVSKVTQALSKSVLQTCPAKVTRIIAVLKDELENSVQFPVRGILLVGPPGTGKSTIPQVMAHVSERACKFVPLIFLGNEFQKSGEQNLRRHVEAIAALNTPYIIVLDDANDLNAQQGGRNPDHGIAVALWMLMDKYKNNKNLIFVGTTNNRNNVPPQLLDRLMVIDVPLPDARAREIIFNYQMEKATGSSESDDASVGHESLDDDLCFGERAEVASGAGSSSQEEAVLSVQEIPTAAERAGIVECLRTVPVTIAASDLLSGRMQIKIAKHKNFGLVLADECNAAFFRTMVDKMANFSSREIEKVFTYAEWIMIERVYNAKNGIQQENAKPTSKLDALIGYVWPTEKKVQPSGERKAARADFEQAIVEVNQERSENGKIVRYARWQAWQPVLGELLHNAIFPIGCAIVIHWILNKKSTVVTRF